MPVMMEEGQATPCGPVRGTCNASGGGACGDVEGSSHKSGKRSSWESVNDDDDADGDDDVENVETV